MIVDELYRDNVGYIMADVWDADSGNMIRYPAGTTFFVGVALGKGYSLGTVVYAVTCRHVIDAGPDGEQPKALSVRINRRDGTWEDVPCNRDQWTLSTETDVAVAQLRLGPGFRTWHYHISEHIRFGEPEIKTGHDVFFVGMFEPLPGKDSVEALVRFGTVARHSARVGIETYPGSDIVEVDAHLVQGMAWPGESGSPVFAYEEEHTLPGTALNRSLSNGIISGFQIGDALVESTIRPRLIGLLYGHFRFNETAQAARAKSARGKAPKVYNVEVNYGVAIVIPSSKITATLMDGRLVSERDRMTQELQQRLAKKAIPIPDSSH
jgi:hypothetical protein